MRQEIRLVDVQRQYQTIRHEVLQAIDATLSDMELFLGPNVRTFEREFADYCGTAEAVGVASGTDALCLALRACDIGPGDEVITVANTFITAVEAIGMVGAKPVFVDVEPETATMDPKQVAAAITPRTCALLPVHLSGQAADMYSLQVLADKYGLLMIEDGSQAQGGGYEGHPVGGLSDIGAFGFHFSKNLGAYGEAGIVTTNNHILAERVRMLRDHGSASPYYHEILGVKYLPLKQEACGRTPPHFGIPLQARRFGFIVRHIGGTRQLPRADPILPVEPRAQAGIPGPHEISVQGELALLAHKEQPVVGAVRAASEATAWTTLAGVVGIHADAATPGQSRLIGEQPAQLRTRPFRGVPVGASLFFRRLFPPLALGALADASQLFQAKETVGMGIQDLLSKGVIAAQLEPSLSL